MSPTLIDQLLGAVKSKTLWAALATLVLANVPGITAWVSANVPVVGSSLGVIFALLRVFTTQSLEAKGNPPNQGMTP